MCLHWMDDVYVHGGTGEDGSLLEDLYVFNTSYVLPISSHRAEALNWRAEDPGGDAPTARCG